MFNVDFKYLFIFQWIRNSRSSNSSKRYLSWFLFSWFLSHTSQCPSFRYPICFQQIPRTVPSAVTYWPIHRGQCAPFHISLRSRQAFHLPSISTQKGFFIFAHSTQKSPGPASIIAMANRRTCGTCNMQYGSIKHKFHNILKTTASKLSI